MEIKFKNQVLVSDGNVFILYDCKTVTDGENKGVVLKVNPKYYSSLDGLLYGLRKHVLTNSNATSIDELANAVRDSNNIIHEVCQLIERRV